MGRSLFAIGVIAATGLLVAHFASALPAFAEEKGMDGSSALTNAMDAPYIQAIDSASLSVDAGASPSQNALANAWDAAVQTK